MYGSKKVSIEHLDLPPGYYTELRGERVYLMDPDGRIVMKLPDEVGSVEFREDEPPVGPQEPAPTACQELCQALLVELSRRIAVCEMLHYRVAILGERLQAVEEERDQANIIAEHLYEHLRENIRITAARKKRLRS